MPGRYSTTDQGSDTSGHFVLKVLRSITSTLCLFLRLASLVPITTFLFFGTFLNICLVLIQSSLSYFLARGWLFLFQSYLKTGHGSAGNISSLESILSTRLRNN